jgi:release factor glutamine methyltransferase
VALTRALPGSYGLAVDASAEALRQAAANLQALLPSGSLIEGPCTAEPQAAVDAEPEPEPGAHPDPSGRMAPGVRLRQGSWWMAIEPWWGRLQLVVSNPPYIPSAVLACLEPVVRDHEPPLALDGGADGLEAIRHIISGAQAALTPGGVLLLEHHHDQSEAVLALLAAAGLEDCRAHRDLEGVRRFASARRPGQADGAVAVDTERTHP